MAFVPRLLGKLADLEQEHVGRARLLTVSQTRGVQGRHVVRFLQPAVRSHRQGLPAPLRRPAHAESGDPMTG